MTVETKPVYVVNPANGLTYELPAGMAHFADDLPDLEDVRQYYNGHVKGIKERETKLPTEQVLIDNS